MMKTNLRSQTRPTAIQSQQSTTPVTAQQEKSSPTLEKSGFHAGQELATISTQSGGRAQIGNNLEVTFQALDPLSQSISQAGRAEQVASVGESNKMTANEKLISDFYTAFSNRDGDSMAAMYHPDASFSDPVFPDLDGRGAGNMWRMLTKQGKDLQIQFKDVKGDGDTVTAKWIADYTFSATGQKVHNEVEATFKIKDGKIVEHKDNFDFYKWTKQAFPMKLGHILGWMKPVQWGMQKLAASGLKDFVKKFNL